MTLAIWALVIAIVLNGVLNMTRNEFLASISGSMDTIASSLTTIGTQLANHPAANNPEFDPDGTLNAAASRLADLGRQARSAADALNPATPGGVNDPANGGASAGTGAGVDTGATSGTGDAGAGGTSGTAGDAGAGAGVDTGATSGAAGGTAGTGDQPQT